MELDLTNRRVERKTKLCMKKVLMIYKKAISWVLMSGSSHSTSVVVCGRQTTSDYTYLRKLTKMSQTLTFKRPNWYLIFTTQFVKNVLFEQKKIKLRNRQHFVKNKMEITQNVC
jgi:hypothetical protein